MPIQTTRLFEIRMRQTFLDQTLVNIFYYRDLETDPIVPLSDILAEFETAVYNEIEDVQSIACIGIDLRARQVGGETERTNDISGRNGNQIGELSTSFTAWGFILNRTTIDMRNGSKRFGGLTTADYEGNSPDGNMITPLAQVAFALHQDLQLFGGGSIRPVIYRRGSFEDPNWFGSELAGAAFTTVTSQVSRKPSG